MNDSAVTLPAMPVQARRAPFPWLAAVVPMIGGVVLWGVTGSMFSLLFALLGPVIAVASLLDSARGARRTHRANLVSYEARLTLADEQITAHHARERATLVSWHPDAMQLASSPTRFWRRSHDEAPELVLGRGARASACRVAAGGDGDAFGESAATLARLRARAGVLRDAPISIPVVGGVMIRGEAPFASAAARALVLQVCMTWAPGALRDIALPPEGWEWARALPHFVLGAAEGVGVGDRFGARSAPLKMMVIDAGADLIAPAHPLHAPHTATTDAVVRIVYGAPDAPIDPWCMALIELRGADGSGQLTIGEQVVDVTMQLVGEVQARTMTAALGERAAVLTPAAAAAEDAPSLASLLGQFGDAAGEAGVRSTPASLHAPGCALPVPFAVTGEGTLPIDIVGDGPHALVAGMTGSGKSELLVSWVTSLCSLYSPERVVFLLADFKGGTAFAALEALPHVVGLITDLDAGAARRALESLRAEVRWREARLAEAGARDIADGRVEMPRLFVVIDEFAALLVQHPELQDLFADIAARGRALGIHLVLGTQRAAGTVREGLLANIPLRMCLRVVDDADSRTVVGASGAAGLPAMRPGAALIRRPRDNAPVLIQVVPATASDRDAARTRWRGIAPPRRPWLPPLATRIDSAALLSWPGEPAGGQRRAGPDTVAIPGGLALGLLDEPAAQRQRPWVFSPKDERSLLVVGGAGAGKSTALHMVEHAAHAAQGANECRWIPADRQDAWDTLELLSGWYPGDGAPTLLLIDDLDVLIAGFPSDYAELFVTRLEAVLREGARTGIAIVASVQRMPISGTRLGDFFNSRLVLRVPHRTDHLAAGADGATFIADRPAGRGVVSGTEVQIAEPPARADTSLVASTLAAPGKGHAGWTPPPGLVGVVTRTPTVLEERLRSGWSADGTVVVNLRALQPGTRVAELATMGPAGVAIVVVGDADAWQQHWSLLAAIRAGHPLIIDGGSSSEFRAMTGSRALPPYIAGDAAWLCMPDASVGRVRLPRPRPGAEPGQHSGAVAGVR